MRRERSWGGVAFTAVVGIACTAISADWFMVWIGGANIALAVKGVSEKVEARLDLAKVRLISNRSAE